MLYRPTIWDNQIMLLIPVNLAYQMVARTGFVWDDNLFKIDYEKFVAERGKNKVDD